MKKVLFALGGLIALLVVAFAVVMGTTFSGLKEMPDAQDLPAGARRVNHSYTSAYLVPMGEKEFALVDCNDDPSAVAIKAELQRRGVGAEAVKAIFLTHGHPDHTVAAGSSPGRRCSSATASRGWSRARRGRRARCRR